MIEKVGVIPPRFGHLEEVADKLNEIIEEVNRLSKVVDSIGVSHVLTRKID